MIATSLRRLSSQAGHPAQAVDDVAAALEISESLDEPFFLEELSPDLNPAPFPSPTTWRTALANYHDLQATPSPLALVACADALADVEEAEATVEILRGLARSSLLYQQWVVKTRPRWRDLWALFPALKGRLSPQRFFEVCPLMAPRYYSISSSILQTPGEVAVTVGQLTYSLPNGRVHRVRPLPTVSKFEPILLALAAPPPAHSSPDLPVLLPFLSSRHPLLPPASGFAKCHGVCHFVCRAPER